MYLWETQSNPHCYVTFNIVYGFLLECFLTYTSYYFILLQIKVEVDMSQFLESQRLERVCKEWIQSQGTTILA